MEERKLFPMEAVIRNDRDDDFEAALVLCHIGKDVYIYTVDILTLTEYDNTDEDELCDLTVYLAKKEDVLFKAEGEKYNIPKELIARLLKIEVDTIGELV